MLLSILNFPFDVDWCVTLNIALNVHLFPLGNRNLLVFRCKMSRHCESNHKIIMQFNLHGIYSSSNIKCRRNEKKNLSWDALGFYVLFYFINKRIRATAVNSRSLTLAHSHIHPFTRPFIRSFIHTRSTQRPQQQRQQQQQHKKCVFCSVWIDSLRANDPCFIILGLYAIKRNIHLSKSVVKISSLVAIQWHVESSMHFELRIKNNNNNSKNSIITNNKRKKRCINDEMNNMGDIIMPSYHWL